MEEKDIFAFDAEVDKIKENENCSKLEKTLRFAFSYTLFFLFLLMACAVTIGFTILQNFTTYVLLLFIVIVFKNI